MEIHKYEKLWFGAALILIIAFIATITYGAVGAGISMIDDDGGTIDSDNVRDHPKFEEIGLQKASEDVDADYEASIIARTFIFQGALTHDPLQVPENSEIKFYITSPDVIHGFQVMDTNVNTMVIPGQIAELTVEFDEPREHGIICNEFCGAGHEDMEGLLEVVPEDEWDDDEMLGGDD